MLSNFKTIILNIVFFILCIILIELFFGGWFSEKNLGAYFREHRMKKVPYSIKYDGKNYNYVYQRNYYGFKGEEIDIDKIQIVFVGGSTGDERWKPEKFSIVENLNKKLEQDKINLKIINAAIEGQSSVGHLVNFKKWFSKLENFNPSYFIFYVGINDMLRTKFDRFDYVDGHAKIIERDKEKIFFDNIKSRSIFYDLLRKTKHKYYSKDKRIFMDLDKMTLEYLKDWNNRKKFGDNSDYDYLTTNRALKVYNVNKILKNEDRKINFFLENIDLLYEYSKSYNATPIFINQVLANGAHEKSLFALNISLINHCVKKNYNCIDLANGFVGEKNYWFDGSHTSPLGSEKIAEFIYPELKKFLKNK